jgi:hypothetical protein
MDQAMITTFEVGSVFRIVDQVSPQLRGMLKSVTELDAGLEGVRKNLTGLARTRLAGVGNQFKAITQEAMGLDKALGGATAGIARLTGASTALGGTTAAITGTSTAVQALADEWRNVATSAAAATAAMRGAGRVSVPAIRGAAGAGAGAGGGSVPPVLPGGGAGRGGRHGPQQQGWHLGRFGVGVPVGPGHVHASTPSSMAGVATGAGLFGIYELMEQAKEPMHQEAMLKLLGISQPTIERMKNEARDIAIAVPGTGFSHNMKNMGELYSIVGAEGAMSIAPKLAEIDRVQSIVGGKGKDQGSAYVLTRATELMGKLTDPFTHQVDLKLFGSVIDNMSKMSIASHGKVTPEEWLNYAKQAGPAAGNLTTEGMYTTSAIIQAMGGNRAGTAAAAVQRQFAGGVMTKSKAEELTNIGIFKPGDYEVGKGGHVTFKNDAGQSFVDKLQKDPLDAVVKDLIPALESHGFDTNEKITKELYRILGTAPEQREIYEIIRGREQIHQERERAMGALAPGASMATLNASDPTQVTSAFTTAFKDLLGAMGGPLMQSAIPGIRGLTTLFNQLASLAGKHPSETGVVGSAAAGTAGGAAIGFGIGWLGGPVGAGGGALIGGVLGTAYGFMNSQQGGPHQTAYERRQDRLRRQGLLPPDDSGIAGGTASNVVPPPQKIDIAPGKVTLNMDGRTIGEAVVNWMVAQGNGPAQGSPYPDTTRGGSTFDFALVN